MIKVDCFVVPCRFQFCHLVDNSLCIYRMCMYLTRLDPLRTAKGHLSVRAMRLTPKMMKMYEAGDFSPDV